jgi:hypothetical protein
MPDGKYPLILIIDSKEQPVLIPVVAVHRMRAALNRMKQQTFVLLGLLKRDLAHFWLLTQFG